MSETHGSHWLEREDIGDVTVVRFKTPKMLDEDTARAVFNQIYTLNDIGRNRLVLNLAAVEYLPSMAIGKLVMLNRKVAASNGRLALCCLTESALETLELTRVEQLFNKYPTEQAALQSFA
jgi:anti-sigma B factor antagonist